jgi:hypothetical protein
MLTQQAEATQHYALCGVRLRVVAPPDLLSAIDARLQYLSHTPSSVADLSFTFAASTIDRPPGCLRPVYDPLEGEVLYSDDADALYFSFRNRIHAACQPDRGELRVSIQRPEPEDDWLLSHALITLPLVEMLKRRGLYSVHAAGVSRAGRTLLLPGTSGSGKSTLAIALGLSGLEFLGDDMLFLSRSDAGLRVHAFPDEVDVTETTIGFFPELHDLARQAARRGWPKRTFRPEAFFRMPVAGVDTTPVALVFPRIAAGAVRSRLEPLSAEDALLDLLPNVLLTEPSAIAGHVEVLEQLTRETACYRLWTARDFDTLPALLGQLLA